MVLSSCECPSYYLSLVMYQDQRPDQQHPRHHHHLKHSYYIVRVYLSMILYCTVHLNSYSYKVHIITTILSPYTITPYHTCLPTCCLNLTALSRSSAKESSDKVTNKSITIRKRTECQEQTEGYGAFTCNRVFG